MYSMYAHRKKGAQSPRRTNVFWARVTGSVLAPLSRACKDTSRTGSTLENEALGQGRNKLGTYYLPLLSSFVGKRGIAGVLRAFLSSGSTGKTRFSGVVFPPRKTGILASNRAIFSWFFDR